MFTDCEITKIVRNLSQSDFPPRDVDIEKQCHDYQYKCGKAIIRKATPDELGRFTARF